MALCSRLRRSQWCRSNEWIAAARPRETHPTSGLTSLRANVRDVIGQIRNLLVADRRHHVGHGGVAAVARIVLVGAQRLNEIILALVGDIGNVVPADKSRGVTVIAAVLPILRVRGSRRPEVTCLSRACFCALNTTISDPRSLPRTGARLRRLPIIREVAR